VPTKIPKGPGHYATCQECGSVVGNQYWDLSKSIGLHKKGTGHRKFKVLNGSAKNPTELLLMGANPLPRSAHRRLAYDALSRNEKLAFGRLGLGKRQLQSEADIEKARRQVKETQRLRNRLPNPGLGAAPGLDSPSAEHARELFQDFTEHASEKYIEISGEPHIPAGNYTGLGTLVSLRIKPMPNGEVAAVQEFLPAGKSIFVICDPAGRQIYFANDGQELSEPEIHIFTDSAANLVELGECRGIVYKAAKWHQAVPASVRGEKIEWDHTFGEDGGYPPKLFFDREKRRLLLEGGSYHVEGRGIVN
jgi:hypothetical protein